MGNKDQPRPGRAPGPPPEEPRTVHAPGGPPPAPGDDTDPVRSPLPPMDEAITDPGIPFPRRRRRPPPASREKPPPRARAGRPPPSPPEPRRKPAPGPSSRSALARRPAPELKVFLLWSLVGHGLLLVGVLGLSAWQSKPRLNLDQKVIKATLVRRGQARDAKLLPRIEEPPPPPPKVETPPPPVPPPPDAPKPAQVPAPAAKPSPTAPAAPSPGAEDSATRRSRLFDAFKKTSQRARASDPLEGAADGDPEGDSATAEGEQYYGLVSRNIKRYYDVAQTIPEQERLRLKTDVFLKVGPTGAVETVKVVGPSGNEQFDNAVLAAVKRAAPFPAPPAHLRDALRSEGVTLRFTAQ